MEEVGGSWLRPATPMEEMFESAHQRGTLLICYHIILNSSARLLEEHVRTALKYLHWKVPNLRVCFGVRDGGMWLRHRSSSDLDFEVMSSSDVQATMERLRTYKYNSSAGPLWCAKLLHETEHLEGSLDSSSKLRFVSHLFLGFHHGIVDGITTMKVCGCLVKLLGDVISGQPISDEEQIGELVSAEETEKLIRAKKLRIETDYELREALIRGARSKCSNPRLLRRIYQAPEGSEDRSAQVIRHLDVATTEKFVNKCRTESLTVHSAFTALANVALTDLLMKENVIQSSYTISSAHTTNLRRYWPGNTSRALGCHISPTYLYTETPRDAGNRFWEYARTLHQNLKSNLESGKALEDIALRQLMTRPKTEEREDRVGDREENTEVEPEYFTSNMGDVTPFVSGESEDVKATHITRSISLHKAGLSCSHVFHTFKGRLTHCLDFSTKFLSEDLARDYCDLIFRRLEEVI
ncbi:uncharacterized protein LOC134762530 isoform X1 [Penaeus indicus]|uniref:uncharacterized protein LOC134762530 isoform X1 n=1 Tax=Penaeus indicus TaxID=29960 RepID=UPI00300CC286